MNAARIDIVLPCYNPGDVWHRELIAFYDFIRSDYNVSFIIVNDGSSGAGIAGRVEEIRRLNIPVRLISYETNHGKGYALRQGVMASEAGFILYTDIDFPFRNKSVLDVMRKLLAGGEDIVAGHRDRDYYLKTMSNFRRSLSKAFRFFLKRIIRLPFADTQCGLKGFNAKGRELFLKTVTNRYLFDFEFIYLAVKDPSVRLAAVEVELKDGVVFSKIRSRILLQEMGNLFRILLFRRTN